MTAVFEVFQPGPYTTVQDLGRFGWQQFGVPPSGMLDRFAGRVANILVGNPDAAALLELTLSGPSLKVLSPAVIALTGAEMPMTVNGRRIEGWQAAALQPGDRVDIGMAASGCRAYLAVAGGIDVPPVMGSRSCYVGAAVGGFEGRPLRSGDVLHREGGDAAFAPRRLPPEEIPVYSPEITLRAVAGPQDEYFDRGLELFFSSSFCVSPQADRMGCRLTGPVIEQIDGMPRSIISEPSLPGGVQIPQDGQPIILLTEQTVGGYTKIATVISSDIPRVAQARPGDTIRFSRIDLYQAHEAYRRQAALMDRIRIESCRTSAPQTPGSGAFDWDSERVVDRLIHHLLQI